MYMYKLNICDYDIIFSLQRGTPIKEAIDKNNNHPHIVRFIDTDLQFTPQIFIVVEQEMIHECKDMCSALFTLMGLHFTFNIEYNSKIKDVLYYVQEKILGISDPAIKKTAIYNNVCAGIDSFLN